MDSVHPEIPHNTCLSCPKGKVHKRTKLSEVTKDFIREIFFSTELEDNMGLDLPLYMCKSCIAKCKEWNKLRTNFEMNITHIMLRNKVQSHSPCETEHHEYVDIIDIQYTEPPDTIETNPNCETLVEDETVANDSISQDNLLEEKLVLPILLLECPICQDVFYNCVDYNKHLVEGHWDDESKPCSICNEISDCETTEGFRMHIYSHTEIRFQCPICRKRIVRTSISSHFRIHHKLNHSFNIKFRQCHICAVHLPTKRDWLDHLLQEHLETNNRSCSICPLKFDSQLPLAWHTYGHIYSKKPKFCCEICGKLMNTKESLAGHILTHSKDRRFECDLCGNKYKCQQSFTKHKATHKMEKTIKCQDCDKLFYFESDLRSHQRMHGPQNRSYICSFCDRGFFGSSAMKEHVRIRHTREKLFPCDTCGKSYFRRRELEEHQRSHTGEKPFSCSVCGRIYARKTTLMTHMKTHRSSK